MEERLTQEQPETTSPVTTTEPSNDAMSASGVPDWPFDDFDDDFQAGVDHTDLQFGIPENHLNANEKGRPEAASSSGRLPNQSLQTERSQGSDSHNVKYNTFNERATFARFFADRA